MLRRPPRPTRPDTLFPYTTLFRSPPLALTVVALAALLLPAVHAPHLRLVWNASASLPTGLYAIEPEADMRVGDLALVRPTPALEAFMAARHYVERHVPLLKPVAAVASDTGCRPGLHVTVDGHAAVSALSLHRIARPV